MEKTYRLHDLSENELSELKQCKDIKFALIENHPIANSQVTDDYGNQVNPLEYTHTAIMKIEKSNEERERKVETFIDSFSTGGKDHRIDRYSKEFNLLKEELGIGKSKNPKTLGEAVTEFEDKINRVFHDQH